jgi:hypothetical protein
MALAAGEFQAELATNARPCPDKGLAAVLFRTIPVPNADCQPLSGADVRAPLWQLTRFLESNEKAFV